MKMYDITTHRDEIESIFSSTKTGISDRGYAIEEQVPQNGLLFIGLNPSYPEDNPGAPGFYNLINNTYPYFCLLREIAEVCNLEFAHHDIYMDRSKNQDEIVKLEKQKRYTEYFEKQRRLCDKIVTNINPKVIVMANAHVSDLFVQKCNSKMRFDQKIGTYLMSINNVDTPVFCSSMITGQRALDKHSRTRLIWQIQTYLGLPFRDIK